GIDVERRIAPTLRSEDRPEQEGPPDERNAPRFGERSDPHSSGVGICARKLVPELRRHRALPAGGFSHGAGRDESQPDAKRGAPSGGRGGSISILNFRRAISSSELRPARRGRPAP